METPPPEVAHSEHTSKVSQKVASDSEFEAKTSLFKAGLPVLPAQDEEKKGKTGFSSPLQYILAVIGTSVGLGNIWRFPAVAYENGGGAFLIPYLCMGLIFGLPMLYIDSTIGQVMQNSASVAFRQYFPAAQGLGWAMALILILIGFCYNVPCTWSLMYIIQLIGGRMSAIASCENHWNTKNCLSTNSPSCHNGTIYFNKECIRPDSIILTKEFNRSATEEFFDRFIVNKHASFALGEFNWMFALCLFVCWSLVAGGLVKGVQSMGRIALITTFLPYFIITVLFIRGITLDGANEGIRYFLTDPDWSKIFEAKTWIAALSQSTFSLSIGVGPMIMLSSYNKRTHPNYRDCVIILAADTFMSILGGAAVFSILGSMSKRMGKEIKDLVGSPLTLTFVAYPDAISRMPVATLWALLFFVMMFIIGISTMFALVEGLATCIVDENPRMAKWHWLITTVICAVCYTLNLFCYSFQNAFHIFSIINNFAGTVAMSGSLLMEVLIITFYYGAPRFFRDIQCMHGLPTSNFSRLFGHLGLYIKIGVSFTAPFLACAMSICIGISMFNVNLSDKVDNVPFIYPAWTVFMGYILASIPLLLIPAGTFINYRRFKKSGEPISDLFRITDDHPSVRYNLPDPVSWKEFFWPSLREEVAVIPDSTKPTTLKDANSPAKIPDQAEFPEGERPIPDSPPAQN